MMSVKYINASIQQIAKANNMLLKQSPEFATLMYHKGLISSSRPYFNTFTVKKIHKTQNWYDLKTGHLNNIGKAKTTKLLNQLCGDPNITLDNFVKKIAEKYQKLKWY